MVLKHVFTAAICTMLLVWSGASIADPYKPGDFLHLDLPKAVLSPKRLGPPTRFAPFPVEAGTDSDGAAPQPRAEEAKPTPDVHVARTAPAHLEVRKPKHLARARPARRHGNPLDAQASDTRIQVWPCRSGGRDNA
jgi:hypothetical protein